MARSLARGWWVLGLRGLFAVFFGILTFAWPGITLEVLILLFGAFVLADGILALTAAARSTGTQPWVTLVLQGIIGIILGIMTLVSPEAAALALVYLIGGWSVVIGALEIGAAIRLRRDIAGEFWLGLAGVVSILFGIMLMVAPLGGILVLLWLFGAYLILLGLLLLTLAFRLRHWALYG